MQRTSIPNFWILTAMALILAAGLAGPAAGITINITFDSAQSSSAPDDPDGDELLRIMNVAANYWEDIIELVNNPKEGDKFVHRGPNDDEP